MKKKEELTADMFVNWWLREFHGTSTEEVLKKHPEWADGTHSSDFYKEYQVTQAEHNQWYDWAIDTIAKYYGWSKKKAKKEFVFAYLNVSPMTK